MTSATTVNGQKATIKVVDGKVMIDGAQVVKTDIECGNGVIHVIDSVIMPK
jgi:transforming growth factor-beta-induced protein